jgi:hypothetical protein
MTPALKITKRPDQGLFLTQVTIVRRMDMVKLFRGTKIGLTQPLGSHTTAREIGLLRFGHPELAGG